MNKILHHLPVVLLILLTIGCEEKPSNQKVLIDPVSENIIFRNEKDRIDLAGTISLPNKTGVFPVAILISGNGEHDRNAAFGEYQPFLDISEYFTNRGIAVLRFDKRGVGESQGNYELATSFDFAEDVQAAIEYLRTRKDIHPSKIGLIGHSEGGLIAPIVASHSSNIAFIISLAGPAIPGAQILLSQQKAIATAKGMTESEIDFSQQLNREAFEIVNNHYDSIILTEKMTSYIQEISENDTDKPANMTLEEYVDAQVAAILRPWMINFLRYRPEQYIQQVDCPVLALNGSKDLQVLAHENLPEWKRILEEAGNKRITIQELSTLNHLFQTCETGLPDEYEQLAESFSPHAMEVMAEWILNQTK